eukprot:COSAG06_NODE_2888_length_6131_cov_117.688660_8_plen_93_part_00
MAQKDAFSYPQRRRRAKASPRPVQQQNKTKPKKNDTVLALLAMIYDYLFLSVCPEPVLANDRCAIEHSYWETVFQTAVVSVRIPRDLLGSAG